MMFGFGRAVRFGLSIIAFILVTMVMTGGLGRLARAQSPTYGLGKTPTADEIRALDISIGRYSTPLVKAKTSPPRLVSRPETAGP